MCKFKIKPDSKNIEFLQFKNFFLVGIEFCINCNRCECVICTLYIEPKNLGASKISRLFLFPRGWLLDAVTRCSSKDERNLD